MSLSISIVVCTHNGANRISNCLSSLVSQENPPEYEILVVDNASSDGTGEMVRRCLGSSFSLGAWRVITEDNPGLLYARLAGLRAARYDWVLFCDDDNILYSDFLIQAQRVLSRDSEIGVVGSLGIPEFQGPKPDWFDRYSSSYAVGPQITAKRSGKLDFVYGACSTYRKRPLLDLFERGFVPALSGRKGKEMSAGDDVEWCCLMQLAGYRIAYSDSLRFKHQLPESRLTWEYYLKMKQGISGSVGLFMAYEFYYSNRQKSQISFLAVYLFQTAKSILLFVKYFLRWKGNPTNPADQLAFEILKSKKSSYLSQMALSYRHFIQLNKYFGS